MPNNPGPLPLSGHISLQDMADVFHNYIPYRDGNKVDVANYYGDEIQWYYPLTPTIPNLSASTIRNSSFYGKQYGLPVPVKTSGTKTNVDLYACANAYTQETYGLSINDCRNIPFQVTLTNTGIINSSTNTVPALIIRDFCSNTSISIINTGTIIGKNGTGGGIFTQQWTTGSGTWTIPACVTNVTATVVGGGGGGGSGYEVGDGAGGGGGGSGGINISNIPVIPGGSLSYSIGGGGAGANTGSVRGAYKAGSAGGTSSATYSVYLSQATGGSGGGAPNPYNAWPSSGTTDSFKDWGSIAGGGGGGGTPGGNNGTTGEAGGYDQASGNGGKGGGAPYDIYGKGGDGAGFIQNGGGSFNGSAGNGGVVHLDYIVNVFGGTAVCLANKACLSNIGGNLIGGQGSPACAANCGYAIQGASYLQTSPGGNIQGRRI